MANAISYDWSLLDRDLIAGMISIAAPGVVNKTLSPASFTSIVRSFLRFFQLPIHLRTTYSAKMPETEVWVGGLYNCIKDASSEICITIQLQFFEGSKKVNLTTKLFRRICYSIADTILHEIIHLRQYRRRQFKDIPGYESTANSNRQWQAQTYLGHYDEIDAYSFNIACQLKDKFKGDKNKIVNYLNSNLNNRVTKKTSFKMYLDAFDHNHNHPVIKKVKKKVINYLPNAMLIGKPYKTTDWLKK
jgi:hypothetical protein